jgi:hypothetical protein
MLIRLRNGTWIDPHAVVMISPGTSQVRVSTGPHASEGLNVQEGETAATLADELAAQINDARAAAARQMTERRG